MIHRRASPPPREMESPWVSFGDVLTGLLFVFIALTFWASWELSRQKQEFVRQEQQAQSLIEELRGARQRARELIGTREELGKLSGCIEADAASISSVAPDPKNTSVALYLVQDLAWFGECSDDLDSPADAGVIRRNAIATIRRCVAEKLLTELQRYDIVLSFEGHTDGGGASGCPGGKKTNWTLSGARSAAVLEAFREGKGAEAEAVRKATGDRRQLQLVAAGLADSRPSWSAICRGDILPADRPVCRTLDQEARRLGKGTTSKGGEELLRTALGSFLSSPMRGYKCKGAQQFSFYELEQRSLDEQLSLWANACPAPYTSTDIDNRLKKLRRVDLRLELQPRLQEEG